jgi:hypothetical protein
MTYGDEASHHKRELLQQLDQANLPTAAAVLELHELLCFWRAYPDDARLLKFIDRMLKNFENRADLRRFRGQLQDSGIVGTGIHFAFFLRMAQWLAANWPQQLTMDWAAAGKAKRLGKILPLYALFSETLGMDEYDYPVREWVDRMKSPRETDATFLVRSLANLPLDDFQREYLHDELDLPMRLAPGPGTPCRTHAKVRGTPITYQMGSLQRGRPDLAVDLERPPLSIADVKPSRARRLIDLARAAMVTRSRDLDVFAWADPRDVRLADCGDGLQFVIMSAVPERRLLLETVYGFLTLKNGVPVGYALNSALFGSVEVAYNIFETYRGAEAGLIFGRVLAMLKYIFGGDTFVIFPYQLGDQNDEALQSGAWWFYQKLGFRPRDPETLQLMRRELARMRKNKRHRSSVATLARLARENVYYNQRELRDDVIGELPLPEVGLRITRYLAERFGSDRRRGEKVCAHEAAERVGLQDIVGTQGWRGFSPGERLAWQRWSPLLMLLPGLEQWTSQQKEDLVAVVSAKGGLRESDFVRKFDGHRRLREAVRRLAIENI